MQRMSWHRQLGMMLLVMGLLSGIDTMPAHAQWVRWRQRRLQRGAEGVKEIALKYDPAASAYRPLDVYYSYDVAIRNEYAYPDRIRVFLVVQDDRVLDVPDDVMAEVTVTDLSDSSRVRTEYLELQWDESHTQPRLAYFDVVNTSLYPDLVQPAHVYRLFITLHRASQRYDSSTVIGKITFPYYVATGGATRLDRARRHIVMRTFREYYYAQHGWDTGEQYPMDCYAYYTWAIGTCTVGAQNGRGILERLFGTLFPWATGDRIPAFAKQGPIHGDYVRKPGHSFMLLAYDRSTGLVWTMEGNFNSTIEIAIRSVHPGWTVGHLAEAHIQPGLFELTETGQPFPDSQPPL
ncbi:MAG: hypothetical protein KatS3mg109_1631 [Pirellulaceae bacterium]|nr:MAG: hypothetical protein KatS3mg109_1631 [Pirellulaceae bacterium]GIW93901.1 MAG: hypothetical protein KatS3mg110_1942 [Pirellulaceae bacterium]